MRDDRFDRVQRIAGGHVHVGGQPGDAAILLAPHVGSPLLNVREVRIREHSRINFGWIDPDDLQSPVQQRLTCTSRRTADLNHTLARTNRQFRPGQTLFHLQIGARHGVARQGDVAQSARMARLAGRGRVKADPPLLGFD